MLTRIHVNQHNIRHNNKVDNPNERLPVITTKTYKENRYSDSVSIVDDYGKVIATLVYRPDNPLSCGSKLWIEADSDNVVVED